MRLRQTLHDVVVFDGIGIHSGASARVTLQPADVGTGVIFHRTGLPNGRERFIPARVTNVVSSTLATRLALSDAPNEAVGTVEHILAALYACGIEDALIEIDGPEVPVLDGSAVAFADACIQGAQDCETHVGGRALRSELEIVEPVRVALGSSWAEFVPADGMTLDIAIDYDHPLIGRQRRITCVTPEVFLRDVAPARTFGFVSDVERLWREGFALGAAFDNTIALTADRVLNPGGLRFPDEFVRHKTLDAIGDLSLLGAPLRGIYRSYRGGHAINRLAVATLLATPNAWRRTTVARPSARSRHAIASAEIH